MLTVLGPISVGAPGFGRLQARNPSSLLLIVFSIYVVVVASRLAGFRSASGRRIAYRNRPLGHPRRVCIGMTRRDVIRAAGAGLLGTSLAKVLAAEEAGAGVRARAKSVMF